LGKHKVLMAFKDFKQHVTSVQLLQRSLERGRLGHAYLFSGQDLGDLEGVAQTLAKTLNCLEPLKENGVAVDCCDKCLNCKKIEHGNHADVFWVRPESKLRVIRMNQVVRRDDSPARVLLEFVNLKPTESEYKFGIIAGADRMNEQAANAFLKTLEEPPAKSILILLTTEPQRILETIFSRCLRLNFGGDSQRPLSPTQLAWLTGFSEAAAAEQKSLLGRYRLMDVLLKKLNELKTGIDEKLTEQSPLQRYKDAERDLQERWEDELKAAIEAEYRRQRSELLGVLQWWLRDVWVRKVQSPTSSVKSTSEVIKSKVQSQTAELLRFPEIAGGERVAQRISAAEALENLQVIEQIQRWLYTNVQEALALEVGLLKLHL
jgi:DNA polymerase-3 subunit delta'